MTTDNSSSADSNSDSSLEDSLASGLKETGSKGTSETIDWESDNNPYKKRYNGTNQRLTLVTKERDEARSTASNIENLTVRIGGMESMLRDQELSIAGVQDSVATQDDGFSDDSESGGSASRKLKVDEVRQRQGQRASTELADSIKDQLIRDFHEGMDQDDPDVKRAISIYNRGRENGSMAEMLEAQAVMSQASTTARAKMGISTSNEEDDASEGSENNNANGGDEGSKSAREQNKDAGVSKGQDQSGSSTVGLDAGDMTPTQMISQHFKDTDITFE